MLVNVLEAEPFCIISSNSKNVNSNTRTTESSFQQWNDDSSLIKSHLQKKKFYPQWTFDRFDALSLELRHKKHSCFPGNWLWDQTLLAVGNYVEILYRTWFYMTSLWRWTHIWEFSSSKKPSAQVVMRVIVHHVLQKWVSACEIYSMTWVLLCLQMSLFTLFNWSLSIWPTAC